MNKNSFLKRLLPTVVVGIGLALSSTGFGYGPFGTDRTGKPLTHFTNRTLGWNPDSGPLASDEPVLANFSGDGGFNADLVKKYCDSLPSSGGGCSLIRKSHAFVSNSDATSIIQNSLSTWKADPYADLGFVQANPRESLGEINICNIDEFVEFVTPFSGPNDPRIRDCVNGSGENCRNPVIFDPSGNITAALFGDNNRDQVLGFAAPIYLGDRAAFPTSLRDKFVGFLSVINGYCVEGAPANHQCRGGLNSRSDVQAIMTHEIGHALGLNHSLVNIPAQDPNNRFIVPANPEIVVTMFPYLVTDAQQTLHLDDMIGLGHLYPRANSLNGRCSINGIIRDQSDTNGLRCAQVIVRPLGNPELGALSFVSGAESSNRDGDYLINNCNEASSDNCGRFRIEGLEPGTYELQVTPLPPSTRGSATGPCTGTTGAATEFAPPLFTPFAAGNISCPPGGGDFNITPPIPVQ